MRRAGEIAGVPRHWAVFVLAAASAATVFALTLREVGGRHARARERAVLVSAPLQLPKRAVLEAQVLARQEAGRDQETLAAGPQTRGARRAASSARARQLAARSEADSARASSLAAEAAKQGEEAIRQETLSRSADARGEQLMQKAKGRSEGLHRQAAVEDKEASSLLSYAKQVAQRMVKREALDEIKHLIEHRGHRAKAASSERSHAPPQGAKVQQPAPRRTRPSSRRTRKVAPAAAARPHPRPISEAEALRREFARWHRQQVICCLEHNPLAPACATTVPAACAPRIPPDDHCSCPHTQQSTSFTRRHSSATHGPRRTRHRWPSCTTCSAPTGRACRRASPRWLPSMAACRPWGWRASVGVVGRMCGRQGP